MNRGEPTCKLYVHIHIDTLPSVVTIYHVRFAQFTYAILSDVNYVMPDL